jgi:hypothetical protein
VEERKSGATRVNTRMGPSCYNCVSAGG